MQWCSTTAFARRPLNRADNAFVRAVGRLPGRPAQAAGGPALVADVLVAVGLLGLGALDRRTTTSRHSAFYLHAVSYEGAQVLRARSSVELNHRERTRPPLHGGSRWLAAPTLSFNQTDGEIFKDLLGAIGAF